MDLVKGEFTRRGGPYSGRHLETAAHELQGRPNSAQTPRTKTFCAEIHGPEILHTNPRTRFSSQTLRPGNFAHNCKSHESLLTTPRNIVDQLQRPRSSARKPKVMRFRGPPLWAPKLCPQTPRAGKHCRAAKPSAHPTPAPRAPTLHNQQKLQSRRTSAYNIEEFRILHPSTNT